jgi:hypothetical protein
MAGRSTKYVKNGEGKSKEGGRKKIKGHATLYTPGVQGDITKQLSKLSHLEKKLRLFYWGYTSPSFWAPYG